MFTGAKSYAEALDSTTLPHSVELAAQVIAVRWRQTLPSKSPAALMAARGSPAGMWGKIHLEDETIYNNNNNNNNNNNTN